MDKNSVIIVEDDEDLRDILVEGLRTVGLDAMGVGTAFDFYQALSARRFDVAIVDLGLPDRNGTEIVSHLRQNTAMGIIVLTGRGQIRDRVNGYDAGADHYFVKPTDTLELAAAVNSLAIRLRGKREAAAGADAGQWAYDSVYWTLTAPSGAAIRLTPKERVLIEALLAKPQETVTRPVILTALKYREDAFGNRALDALVRRLRRKVEETAGQELPVQTVHAYGYVFSAPFVAR